jgi:hypothetical protein
MKALSVEAGIPGGNQEVKELFRFVQENTAILTACEMEKTVFSKVMKIGRAAMKCCFAEKGTGDVGLLLQTEEGVLRKESDLRGRDCFSVFGKIKVPRAYYRREGCKGIFPLDAEADLPDRSYSYLLQEWTDFFCIRDTFGESQFSLEKLLGLKISTDTLEKITDGTSQHYDKYYETKELPVPETEGEILAVGFDGKGVPVIKRETAELKARYGKGEKRQKKKEAMVGVAYTVDRKERTAEEVAKNLIYPEEVREKKQKEQQEAKA